MSRIIRHNEQPVQVLRLRDLDQQSNEQEGIFELADMVAAEQPESSFVEEQQGSVSSVPEAQETASLQSPAVDVEAERQEAYELGLAHGREEAHSELQSATRALLDGAKQLDGLRSTLYQRQKDDLVRLALVIAEQVIGQELTANEEAIVGVVENALKSALETDSHHIRVHPDDLAVVQTHKPLFLANVHGLKEISVEADTNVSRGGCVIESDMGEVDASLETRLAGIASQLQNAVRQ